MQRAPLRLSGGRVVLRVLPLVLPLLLLGANCRSDEVARVGASAPDTLSAPLAEYTGTLLASARLSTLAASERAAWDTYLLTSRRLMAADKRAMQQELTRAGLTSVRRPPNTESNFTVPSGWTAAWTQSPAGRAMVTTVISYQTPAGGWGKHIDYAMGPRAPGTGYNSESDAWAYVGTIDNGATVTELRLLGLAATVAADTAVAVAFARGVRYLLTAQFPSGCWPQVYPLVGSYHDAATHNDDAIVNVLRLLRDVARGAYATVAPSVRTEAANAVHQALRCLVAQQVVVSGVRTTWGQQHDPLNHAPILGRAYELPSLSGREGARVMSLLMEEASPSADVVEAVHAAAAYYRSTSIPNVVYVSGTGLVATPGAGPVWPRMLEIGTNRALFANRDGVPLYDHAQLTDRRTGYAWFGTEPAGSLRTFESWSRSHPSSR